MVQNLNCKRLITLYGKERSRGEQASPISCNMKENLGSTEEDVLSHMKDMIREKMKELNWELLKPNTVAPISSKKHTFDIMRDFYDLYKYRDGYSVADKETKHFVMRTMFEPVLM